MLAIATVSAASKAGFVCKMKSVNFGGGSFR